MDAAETLSRSDKLKTLNSKVKKSSTRNVLCSPYNTKWPSIDSACQKSILEKLKKYWSCPLSRNDTSVSMQNSLEMKNDDPSVAINNPLIMTKDTSMKDCPVVIKDQSVVIGLQKITRCLERDRLQLIVVDRSAPLQLHRHLIQLSAVRGCAAVAVDSLATTLCPVLNVSRLCVLGFKKDLTSVNGAGTKLQDIVDFIADKAPPIDLPWLQFQRPLMVVKEHDPSTACPPPLLVGALPGSDGNITDVLVSDTSGSEGDPDRASSPETAITPKPAVDYSHLYIFKSVGSKSNTFTLPPTDVNFLSFGDSVAEEEEEEDDRVVVLSMRPHWKKGEVTSKYERTCLAAGEGGEVREGRYVKLNVGNLMNNPKKKNKKKKIKNKVQKLGVD